MDIEYLRYLENFKTENANFLSKFQKENVASVGEKIVEVIKKEGGTYVDVYASLQYAYNKLKFESDFVQIEVGNDLDSLGNFSSSGLPLSTPSYKLP